jgi:hypothetical protein
MANSLVENRRTKQVTGKYVTYEDYDAKPRLCRHGVWVGLKTEFSETVVVSYEHGDEEVYVGWSINGITVCDPGYGPIILPPGFPAPKESSVLYSVPTDGFFHRLSLRSSPGSDTVGLLVQVLYRLPNEQGAPAHAGPSTIVYLSGNYVEWPAWKLEEERQCLLRWRDIADRYVRVRRVPIGEPVIDLLARAQGDVAVRLRAILETIDQVDPVADANLATAMKAEIDGLVDWLVMPGAKLEELSAAVRPK